MPKSTTSKHGRHVAVNEKQWLISVEQSGQNLKHGGARNRRESAYVDSSVAGDVTRDAFESEDDYWHEQRAPVQVQTDSPPRNSLYSLERRLGIHRERPGYTLRSDVDWGRPDYSSCCISGCGVEDVDRNAGNEDNADDGLSAIVPRMNRFDPTASMPQASAVNQHRPFFETGEGSQLPSNSPIPRRAKSLPDWVHPKWARKFLPTLAHALYISKDPFEEFRSSSPTFVATVETIFRLVYPDAKYAFTENCVFVEEAALRLTAKRSKIAAAVLEHVKQFFKQPQFADRPDDVKSYARWALLPDGPAFHDTPTPITCKFERDHKDYIEPRGTFQSTFIRKSAKSFLSQAKGSVLDPAIGASEPPKGLYALLLVSVERAFLAFRTGSYTKPKTKFSSGTYHTQLETYLMHLDTLSQRTWDTILCQLYESYVIIGTTKEYAEASAMSINRRNIVICP